MITREQIIKLVGEYIVKTDYFIVDVRVSQTMKITVLFDRMNGGLMVEDCVNLSRFIESRLDRSNIDFELQVSSPGLDMPFLVHQQYLKNQGRKITVVDTTGNSYTGVLKNVTTGGFELETEVKLKGKITEKKEISLNFDQVKGAKSVIEFK